MGKLTYNQFTKNLLKATAFFYCFIWSCFVLQAQQPHHVVKDDESGLPSNEVYSILTDTDGFIWLGSDAGLFRFNGVRYQGYNCKSQTSKAITGLCFSNSGKLYCYNFKGQLFCVSGEKMFEIKHPYGPIQDITTNKNGEVFLNYNDGIAVYNEKTRAWKNFDDFGVQATFVAKSFTKSARVKHGDTYFITTEGLGKITKGRVAIFKNKDFSTRQLGSMIVANSVSSTWVFSSAEQCIYKLNNGKLYRYQNAALEKMLLGRKITNVKFPGDGNLWICTYTGIIKFNPSDGYSALYFPNYSFSDILRDKEGKYWFSTLHNGLIYVSNLNSTVWNMSNTGLLSNKITHVTTDERCVYFATSNGQLGCIDKKSNALKIFETENSADIQSLYVDGLDNCLYFSQSNIIYQLKNGKIQQKAAGYPSVKKMLHVGDVYCFASSNGLLIKRKEISPHFEIIDRNWNRDLLWIESKNELWTATNDGIFVYELKNDGLKLKQRKKRFEQILSLAYDPFSRRIYALSFDGTIWQFNPNGTSIGFAHLDEIPQANNFIIHQNKLFVSTSKGLIQYLIADHSSKPTVFKKNWTTSDGFASNNIAGICFSDNSVWLAGGRGVQYFSLIDQKEPERGEIFLQKLLVTGEKVNVGNTIELKQGQGMTLFPESNLVSQFGNFQFAYRFNQSGEWHQVSGINEQLFIPSVPEGDFTIELKLSDNYGRDSINTIHIKGYMQPPFYRSAWFFVFTILLVLVLGFTIYRFQIKRLERKQKVELAQLQLESDLRLTQQTALKAQMNPHFIFNVLNSIKSYIYKNDKVKAASYLSDFSDLIRGILNMTNTQYVALSEELAFLKIYVELEGMMLNDDFEFTVEIEDDLDLEHIELPSLLLQPFVENAFKHGLHHKAGKKNLLLSICKIENGVQIEITDNGVGREASKQINADRSALHQSFATSATEKRIELINREGRVHVNFAILDLENEAGTTVKIEIISTEE